ncbi:hypothetical protein [Agrobacterium genomosp. 2]|jgi:hypothetical protein|uniref:Uncharacterized protein n=1 Tax=Agrobacterium genomosp. 2 str. CFBP 5494 TaxID=1183436 RepID=A0A9W5F8B6_9HYPH|nr:hypothetical protein [Agrobacterium genomosp. 2]CUX03376.1 hypothetical protein AGR2A_pb10135 [Agrobacterium genomosp. 2 str. CFBP 5494]
MIISRTVPHLSLTVSAPTIGMREAKRHLVRHRHLFDDFVSILHAAGKDPSSNTGTRAPRLSLCIETDRVRLTANKDSSWLPSGDSYSFLIDLPGHLTSADIRTAMDQDALLFFASIQSRVIAVNSLGENDLDPWFRVQVLMKAIEQDAKAVCLIISNAAAARATWGG